MAAACGLNAVQTYIHWAIHEGVKGDIVRLEELRAYLDAAAAANLLVILRVGPYCCAETEHGCLPGWLLENGTDAISLRSADPAFLTHVDAWFGVLLPLLKPYLYSNGGPVVLAQVENEGGFFFSNAGSYVGHLRDALMAAWGPGAVIIHSTDSVNATLLYNTHVAGVYQTIDFGAGGDVADTFALQAAANADDFGATPAMNSEYYIGGMNANWGDGPYVNDSAWPTDVAYYSSLLAYRNASVNLYMFSGGTNWGFEAGLHAETTAHWQTGPYIPGAPLSEAGDPTERYAPLCAAIAAHKGTTPLPPPPVTPKSHYMGTLFMTHYSTLWNAVSLLQTLAGVAPRPSFRPLTFEQMSLAGGYALYRTNTQVVLHDDFSNLYIRDVRDRAYVFVNESHTLTVQRSLAAAWEPTPPSPYTPQPSVITPFSYTLDVLVENEGRLCFGPWMGKDNKGLVSGLQLGPYAQPYLYNWTTYPLPMTNLSMPALAPVLSPLPSDWNASASTPTLYAAAFTLNASSLPLLDTFLDMRGWGKGFVVLNGFNLGRFWYLGPEFSLYVPAALLREGLNDVVVFEADGVLACPAACRRRVRGEELGAAASTWGGRHSHSRSQQHTSTNATQHASCDACVHVGPPSITMREVPVRDLPVNDTLTWKYPRMRQ